MTDVAPRVLAFYLPQFHPIAENDRWWGDGFTEWTSVRAARPLFEGHVQPVQPGELGHYDLRSAETRTAQAQLARSHGISGFCYYHYWFKGRRLLGRVLDEVLAERSPDFPFCLCWANESWTRAWDGREDDVLLRQTYDAADDRRHLHWLARVFEDPRYIRINGRPLFLVYRPSRLPNAALTASMWREEAQRLGIADLYLCGVESLPEERRHPASFGFDAAVEFQPDWKHLGAPAMTLAGNSKLFDYGTTVNRMLARPAAAYLRYPCVTTAWDNSPRRQRDAVILAGSTPQLYGRWLRAAIARMSAPSPDENLVFINAWNEWGEGAHLEPSAEWGRAYLEETAEAVRGSSVQVTAPPTRRTHGRTPRVTVAMPTCNGATYVEEAIASVLAQTFDDFELVIVDDCSDDDTVARVSRFSDARMRVERHAIRRGLVGNWNRCLSAASGDYLTIFHQDDLMARDNLARKVALLDVHPQVAFVHSNVEQVGPDGTVLSPWWYAAPEAADAGVHRGRDFLERLFWGDNVVCCPSVLLRRQALLSHGVFDSHLPFTADWEMWMRLCLFYDVAYMPETLVSYRRHAGAETERFPGARGLAQYFLAKHRLVVKYGEHLPEDWRMRLVDQYGQEAQRLASEALADGRPREAWELFMLAGSVHAHTRPVQDDIPEPDPLSGMMPAFFDRVAAECDRRTGRAERDSWRRRCELLEHEVSALRTSLSWKVTAPLRLLFRVLSGRST